MVEFIARYSEGSLLDGAFGFQQLTFLGDV